MLITETVRLFLTLKNTVSNMLSFVVYVLMSLNMVKCDDYTFRSSLYQNLIDPVNPQLRPIRNEIRKTNISIAFNLIAITEFDELRQSLCTSGYFEVIWQDEILMWNPYDHGGVAVMSPRFDHVWKPAIAVDNTVDDLEPVGLEHGSMILFYNGSVRWYPGSSLRTFCRMNVAKFPFDVQVCNFQIFIWGETADTAEFVPAADGVSLNVYNPNSEWEIINTTSKTYLKDVSGYDLPYVSYTLYLKRRPSVKILTVILPVLMLCILNVVVFLIPVLSGEKLSFAITVLLAFAVFMSFITNMLPHSADSMSIFTLLMAGLFVLSSIYVILTIWVVAIFHRDQRKRPIPHWIRRLMKRDSRVEPVEINSEKPSDLKKAWDTGLRDDLTWRKVSETVDKMFFWVFLLLALSLLGVTVYFISR